MQKSLPSELNANAQEFLQQAKPNTYKACSVIVAPESSQAVTYLLVKGTANQVIASEGKEVIVGLLQPGDYFGEFPFPGFDGHSFSIQARTPCLVASMPTSQFKALIQQRPALLVDVCSQLNARLNAVTQKVGNMAFLDITGRIISVIQELVKASFAVQTSEGTVISITRQELGRLASCSRETAGRVLKLLEEQGLLRCSGRKITVLRA